MRKLLPPCVALFTFAGIAGLGWWGRLPPGTTPAQASARTGACDAGYGAAFAAELQRVGQISTEEFARRYKGKANYLPGIDWDPTTATFYDRFDVDPNKGGEVRARGPEEKMLREWARKQGKPYPEGQPVMVPIHGSFDFRLDPAELAVFKKNGFVVSERMGAQSCTEMFYRIYKRDLPVLITSDAILHAWHRSYDALLEEVETSMLIPALDEMLTAMAVQVPAENRQFGGGLFMDSVPDADYFIAVARSLLAGQLVPSALGQDAKVKKTLEACDKLQLQEFELFGSYRKTDFSQFKPRGHYEKSDQLKRYFKAMMWCGRIDLRVAGNPKESSARQLASAVVLTDLMQKSGKLELWDRFDRVIRTFVGYPDSMTFAQMNAVLASANIRSPADVKDEATLRALGEKIGASDFGAQEIRGDVFIADPYRPGKLVLPRSFAFLGQKFVIDSWVTAQVVYDDIQWDGERIMRRIPSCLDVSFSVFGNDATVPLLVDRMNNPIGRKFRDGLPYQHNLAAVRNVIDAKPESTWNQNLYTGWLGSLRELSKPTDGKQYPEAMRTQAWAMKTLNTQHASWTQLRHDTILYVKPSYTAVPACYYPAGFVEPVPHFWAKLQQMAARAADLIEATPYPVSRTVKVTPQVPPNPGMPTRDKHIKFLRSSPGPSRPCTASPRRRSPRRS
jgi:hypothetical protein